MTGKVGRLERRLYWVFEADGITPHMGTDPQTMERRQMVEPLTQNEVRLHEPMYRFKPVIRQTPTPTVRADVGRPDWQDRKDCGDGN